MLHPIKMNYMNFKKQLKKISKKGFGKDLIDKFSILNGAKYFSAGIFQNYLVFLPAKKTLNILVALLGANWENLVSCQKKTFKI